ncbi:DUF3300 domain-containing protein [Serratia grimesii]|uniref:DUF3300 domain-containing protein n=1 Tax=Serratia grimesii TaxID=82995 RepID=UPI00077C7B90|nr:DUF3300 domain-containing protein [Serratia grimesii]CAI0758070.1 Protein of uncharacterised function (DUF3300) [Serratia grimesii]CAI2452591.1 Protein of uncharacterised function (DUF3300) [Serratia grimesii]SUI32402.1 Protein of uncharacterised function (DUF3300) [Serratia grimesii]
MFKPSYLTWLICIAMLPLSGCDQKTVANTMGGGSPTAASPAPPPAYTPLSADQLYQLVSPVALFPDKLLAQVLAGAGYPDQISAADNWLGQNRGLQPAALTTAADTQPWDPSVRSLVQFPDVLDQMAKNIPWTTALGSAYLNDPTDVMNAIQVLRQRASAKGTLKTSPQQRVIVAPTTQYVEQQPYPQSIVTAPAQTIVIEPSQPDVVYVPRYDPWVAYGEPIPAYPNYNYQSASSYSSGDMLATGVISFGVGIVVGALINQNHHDDWHSWDVHWNNRRQPVVYNNAPYISHSTTVVNRVTNINQYNNVNRSSTVNNVNRSNTVNNFNNAPVNQAPRFAAPVAHPAPNVATMQQPHFATQAPVAAAGRQPMVAPNFTHTGTVTAPHVTTPSAHSQQPMTMPNFSHTAPATVKQPPKIQAAPRVQAAPVPAHQTDNRPIRQPEQRTPAPQAVQQAAHIPAPKPVVHTAPAANVFRPQPVQQRPNTLTPPNNNAPRPFHPQQVQQVQHRPAPAVRPQEHRPVKIEERKTE